MARTTFEDIWDEYLQLGAAEKPQFLYNASITLQHQGNLTAQRALIYQAIEDAFSVGDSQTAANATVELSNLLIGNKEHVEATQVIIASIKRFAPWQSFELGLSHRSLAWSYKAIGDKLKHEECLLVAIFHFDSSSQFAWSYPLRNELGEVLLSRGDWSALADLLSTDQSKHDESAAPIARVIREYLLGRIALQQFDLQSAIRHLLGSVLTLELENHRLFEEAADSLSSAIQRRGEDVFRVLENYGAELGIQPVVRDRLAAKLLGRKGLPL